MKKGRCLNDHQMNLQSENNYFRHLKWLVKITPLFMNFPLYLNEKVTQQHMNGGEG